MSGLMQCPSCKENIDDDSHYCDQCGEQVLVCSSCGRPGKSKRCIYCGKEMVAAGTAQSQQPAFSATSAPPPLPQQPAQSQPTVQPVQHAPLVPPPAGEKIKLSSQSLGINIEASNGDILGRTNGPFAGILGHFSHISGTHCRMIKTGGGWSIEDMGSTNGTFYHNNRLVPNNPMPVQSGTNVKLADIDLSITYGGGGGTQRI